jgi:hypothetical protein
MGENKKGKYTFSFRWTKTSTDRVLSLRSTVTHNLFFLEKGWDFFGTAENCVLFCTS